LMFWWLIHFRTLIFVPTVQVLCNTWQEKYWAYDECNWEVQKACFSPLVFSATGGMQLLFFFEACFHTG